MQVHYVTKPREQVKTSNQDWMHWSAIVCAVLLIANALTFYWTERTLVVSDTICGALIAALAILGLTGERTWLRWPMACIASWLFFAPLIFWAKSPAAYLGERMVGVLLIAMYWIVTSVRERAAGATEIPPGWSYNPSSWPQRIPLIGLALVGFFISRYLAAYQLGHIETVWDPVFQGGTQKVLSSEISKAFIISDAGLGAVSYLIDAVAGAIGGSRRWQTMPWMVLLFSILVIPPGVVSIILVIMQPLGVGAWCTLCLFAAMSMLLMVPLAFDETIATVQYLARAKAAGHGVWETILHGTDVYADLQNEAIREHRERAPSNMPPVTLLLCFLLSCCLLVGPYITGSSGDAAAHSIVLGAIAATIAVMAFAEVLRSVRFLNVLVGMWLLASCVLLDGYSQFGLINAVVVGILLMVLSIPKESVEASYESWNKYIR